MATELATAYVRIVPTTEGIGENLNKAMAAPSESAGRSSGRNIAAGIAKGLGAGAVAVGAAAATMVTGIVKGGQAVATYGDEVDKMSQKLGLSRESYQQWDYVLNLAGTDINSMTTGLKTMTNQLDSAKGGNEAAVKMFESLGLSMEELSGMSREGVFEAVINGFQGMEDSTERAALANDLFGRSGQNLAPLFNQSAELTQEQMELAREYGMVMSDELVADSAAFVDAQTTLSNTIGGVKNRLLGEFLPALIDTTNGLAALFAGDMAGLETVKAGLEGFIGTMTGMLPTVLEVGSELVMTLVGAIIDNVPQLFGAAVNMITQFAQAIVNALPQVVSAALQLILALVQGIGQALPTLIPAVVQVITTVVQTIIQALPTLVTAVIQLIQGIVQGIISAIPVLMEAIPPIIEALLTALPEIITAICDGIDALIPMLIDGIMAVVDGIVTSLPTIMQALIAALPTIITSIIDGLLGNIGTLIEGLITLVIGIVEAMPMIISTLIEYLPELVITVAQTLIQNLPTIIQAVVQIIAGVVQALPSIFNRIIGTTAQLIVQLAMKVGQLYTNFVTAAGQWIKGLIQGIGNAWGNLVSNIRSKVSSVVSNIGSWFTSGTGSIGQNFARGIWYGISSGWNWLTSQVRSLANRLKNAVKSALGIHSPSTEMEWVGEMFNAGLAQGLGETSQVERALYGVNSLLTDTVDPSIAMSADYGATGAGSLLEVVQELRKDVKNLKIYLDTGALVGGIISDTDASLGKRDTMAARGGALV